MFDSIEFLACLLLGKKRVGEGSSEKKIYNKKYRSAGENRELERKDDSFSIKRTMKNTYVYA